MSVTLPTATQFRDRFPEFDAIYDDDYAIDYAIADAGRVVDDTWLEDDIEPAILFLAAHYLSASLTSAETVEDGGPPIKSETIGRISTTYGDPASSSSYMTSEYGSRFEEIRIRNRNHAVII